MKLSRLVLLCSATACFMAGPATIADAHVRHMEQGSGVEKKVDLADQVVIKRTDYGVPHIMADNMEAAGYAMGFLQMEDYGIRVAEGLVRVRGEWARYHELKGNSLRNTLESDAAARLRYQVAAETFSKINKETRDLLKGYAAGVNRYIELNPGEFPDWMKGDFTGVDVHARSLGTYNNTAVRTFLNAQRDRNRQALNNEFLERNAWASLAMHAEADHPEAGSNVWALAPERTKDGHAILMRNPHLDWNAGYYEAQMVVPGHFNFYGDFRVGEPLGIVGGFNEYLGWCTTNNYTDVEEVYGLKIDPADPNRYLLDGVSHALITRIVEVDYRVKEGWEREEITFLSTPYGPVIHQDEDHIYVIRAANEGEYRTNEQFLRMMSATNLEEWKDGMRMQARVTSNFTYADRDGNIFYVWNGSMPAISHESGKDTAAVYVHSREEIWTELMPWDQLPQVLNPEGGYVRNENDPFHYTNLNEVFDEADFPDNYPKAQLRLRSQLSLQLIANDEKFSLEDIVELKHDMSAILADRVKDDLIRAVENSRPNRKQRQAINHLRNWDNTVAADSKGGVLFETWWNRYVWLAAGKKRVSSTPESAGYNAPGEALFTHPWSKKEPVTTPRGLAQTDLAVEAFEWAIAECEKQFGGWDKAWGEVYRARIGDQDYPVGGASGDMGAFRVLWFVDHAVNKHQRQVRGGDGWVFAVEFAEVPRAYSVLAYGQSIKRDSPYYADQLKMFTENEMKPVFYTKEDVDQNTIKQYRPGK